MVKPVEWQPRGVVGAESVRHQSPVERFLPEGPLATVVERFWTISWDLRGQPSRIGETLPHPSVYLVVEAGRSGLAGVNTGRFQRLLEGKGRVYGVKFHPGCFRPFWPAPVRTLTDRILPLESAFGPEGAELEGAVLRCGDDVGAAVALLEAFLLRRLPPPDARAQLAKQVVSRILEDRDLTQVEAVAREVGMSLRSLQRLFLDCVGVSPKWVIERYRLHEAMERLETDPSVDLPGLALALGYFDQAHFIRAFKRLLGRTPGGYTKASEG